MGACSRRAFPPPHLNNPGIDLIIGKEERIVFPDLLNRSGNSRLRLLLGLIHGLDLPSRRTGYRRNPAIRKKARIYGRAINDLMAKGFYRILKDFVRDVLYVIDRYPDRLHFRICRFDATTDPPGPTSLIEIIRNVAPPTTTVSPTSYE